MFDTSKLEVLCNDVALIKSEYKVLLEDDFPILFIGKNRFDNIMICSHLDEDYTNRIINRLQTIVSLEDFTRFMNGEITYQSILQNSKNVFLVQYDFNLKLSKAYYFSYKKIPKKYKPLEDSYYENPKNSFNKIYFNFVLSKDHTKTQELWNYNHQNKPILISKQPIILQFNSSYD